MTLRGYERSIAKVKIIGIYNVSLVSKRPFKNSLRDISKNLPRLFLILSETIINSQELRRTPKELLRFSITIKGEPLKTTKDS